MRAWEFLNEDREPPSKPITIRAIHKMKLAAKRHQASEEKRHALMAIMYADPASEQVNNDLERQRLELEQLRTEIAATKAETKNKSATLLHHSAKRGIKAAEKSQNHVTKLAKSGLGRKFKA
ncbi:MAG: hypothetical protein H8E36_14760 [Rhodospirillaceae bacterium]|nr:hypothetical protein [Rhodospirillaceae bacterium]